MEVEVNCFFAGRSLFLVILCCMAEWWDNGLGIVDSRSRFYLHLVWGCTLTSK
jgi:hypothetical protein